MSSGADHAFSHEALTIGELVRALLSDGTFVLMSLASWCLLCVLIFLAKPRRGGRRNGDQWGQAPRHGAQERRATATALDRGAMANTCEAPQTRGVDTEIERRQNAANPAPAAGAEPNPVPNAQGAINAQNGQPVPNAQDAQNGQPGNPDDAPARAVVPSLPPAEDFHPVADGLDPVRTSASAQAAPVRALEARLAQLEPIEEEQTLQQKTCATQHHDYFLASTRMAQTAPRRKRAERAVCKIESEVHLPPPTPRGRLSPLLSRTARGDCAPTDTQQQTELCCSNATSLVYEAMVKKQVRRARPRLATKWRRCVVSL